MEREERHILERLVVGNEDLDRLESRLNQFNIFEAIGAVRSELRHSDYLSFLLDPSANHGLDDEFLKRFLKRVLMEAGIEPVSAIDIDVSNLSDAEVRREWRDIDILIFSLENNLVIAIENKVGTSEHSNQLQRYKSILADEFPDGRKVLIYLTPSGDPPSDEDWIPFSYEGIATVVERILGARASVLGEDVRMLCRHYHTMIRRHIVSESEVAELCRKLYRHHKQAFDLVFEHRPDLQLDLSEFLRKFPAEKSDELVLDQCSKSSVRFAARQWDDNPAQHSGAGWTKTKRVLLFEIQNLPDSVSLKLIIGPGDDDFRSPIWEAARQDRALFSGFSPKLYPKYSQIYAKKWLSKKDYDDPNIDAMKEKLEKRWDVFVADDYPKVLGALESVMSST